MLKDDTASATQQIVDSVFWRKGLTWCFWEQWFIKLTASMTFWQLEGSKHCLERLGMKLNEIKGPTKFSGGFLQSITSVAGLHLWLVYLFHGIRWSIFVLTSLQSSLAMFYWYSLIVVTLSCLVSTKKSYTLEQNHSWSFILV